MVLHLCKPETGTTTAISCRRNLDKTSRRSPLRLRFVGILLAGLLNLGGWAGSYPGGQSAIAAEPVPSPSATPKPNLLPSAAPLDVVALRAEALPAPLRSAATISPIGLTVPSLWWAEEHHAAQDPSETKLIENWLAYPLTIDEPGRVDVVVNRQLWSLLDYLERYEFINEFGNSARDFGYNLRVFDSRARLLGAYTCDFSSVDLVELQEAQRSLRSPFVDNRTDITISTLQRPTTLMCDIVLDSSGKSGLRGR
ncbi:hypothetical protein ACN4EK_21890 [Pantanalinema rosaneae CENA516]|uniref:hypothetical protein n=1 Tax=Pantanalinema rosaneae TaxID=1620701 RepID=UPI003D701AF0